LSKNRRIKSLITFFVSLADWGGSTVIDGKIVVLVRRKMVDVDDGGGCGGRRWLVVEDVVGAGRGAVGLGGGGEEGLGLEGEGRGFGTIFEFY